VAAESVFGNGSPFTSAEADAASGGTEILSFFSIPRNPAANNAATLRYKCGHEKKDYGIMWMHVCTWNSDLQPG